MQWMLFFRDCSNPQLVLESTSRTPPTPCEEVAQLTRLPEWAHPQQSCWGSGIGTLPQSYHLKLHCSTSAGTTGTSVGTPSSIAPIEPLPDVSEP